MQTFEKIQQLLKRDPFEPFILQINGKEVHVTHQNAVAFHPEVPFITVYDRTEIYDIPIDHVDLIERQHQH